MASVEVTITGMLYDKLNRTTQNVVLVGEASLTGLGVGGGPIIPPQQPPGGGGGDPPGIWGGGNVPMPTPPIANVPGAPGYRPPNIWGPPDGRPTPPIVIPPDQVPPEHQPPQAQPPGSPTAIVPGEYPVNPVTPQPYYVFNWPGIGPVYIYPPAQPDHPAPQQQQGRR